jgi:hypothetical protein
MLTTVTQVIPIPINNIVPIRGPPKTFSDREDTKDDTITTFYCLCDDFPKAINQGRPGHAGPAAPHPRFLPPDEAVGAVARAQALAFTATAPTR